MREDYALRYLRRLFEGIWDRTRLNEEVGWLRRISAYKYDSYQDYYGGERFVSALIRWLFQFEVADREYAYKLLRERLVFLSAPEIHHLVRRTIPAHFKPIWAKRIAREKNSHPYLVWSSKDNVADYRKLLRRSLFLGLSDGARIDTFRRSGVGIIGNEQIAGNYELHPDKLNSMMKDLKKDQGPEARFEMIFLIDDFMGSGRTLCRSDDGVNWKGKIAKFEEKIQNNCAEYFTPTFEVVVHHYMATEFGLKNSRENINAFCSSTTGPFSGKNITITADLEFSTERQYTKGKDPELDRFLMKYYDSEILTESLETGGKTACHGYSNCGLTLVLEHNSPNNSLSILWAQSGPEFKNHKMQPLFIRRERHT